MSLADLILLAAVALVFAPLERLRPARALPRAPGSRWTDALHVFVGGNLVGWGIAGLLAMLGALLARVSPGAFAGQVRGQPGWLQFLEILLISDFAFYAAHRLFHAVPALWRFHEVHHSSEKLDWLAGHRVHPVDQIVNGAIIAAPGLILGFAPGPLLAYAIAYRFHAVLLHSNVRASFGPLNWLIASPGYHHWHHADQPEAYDKNFGGQLVIFDRVFGTLNPAKGAPAKYGLSAPIAPDYVGQLLHPFRIEERRLTATGVSRSGS